MRFRRKDKATPAADAAQPSPEAAEEARSRPFDVSEVETTDETHVDLGSLLFPRSSGRELRLQVNERTKQVQSVMLAGADGAMEVRAFAAARNADMWHDIRAQLVDDVVNRGGTASIEDGEHGPEIVVKMEVQLPDGRTGRQDSRIMGFNGPRWFVRATLLGPASESGANQEWLDALFGVVVNRGSEARPVGEPLPIELPGSAVRMPPA